MPAFYGTHHVVVFTILLQYWKLDPTIILHDFILLMNTDLSILENVDNNPDFTFWALFTVLAALLKFV